MFEKWKKFFVITNNDLFWVKRDSWPKDPDLITKYVNNGYEQYVEKCKKSFFPPHLLETTGNEEYKYLVEFNEIIQEFLESYHKQGIEKAEIGYYHLNRIVISTHRKPNCLNEQIPMYYKGVQVK